MVTGPQSCWCTEWGHHQTVVDDVLHEKKILGLHIQGMNSDNEFRNIGLSFHHAIRKGMRALISSHSVKSWQQDQRSKSWHWMCSMPPLWWKHMAWNQVFSSKWSLTVNCSPHETGEGGSMCHCTERPGVTWSKETVIIQDTRPRPIISARWITIQRNYRWHKGFFQLGQHGATDLLELKALTKKHAFCKTADSAWKNMLFVCLKHKIFDLKFAVNQHWTCRNPDRHPWTWILWPTDSVTLNSNHPGHVLFLKIVYRRRLLHLSRDDLPGITSVETQKPSTIPAWSDQHYNTMIVSTVETDIYRPM